MFNIKLKQILLAVFFVLSIINLYELVCEKPSMISTETFISIRKFFFYIQEKNGIIFQFISYYCFLVLGYIYGYTGIEFLISGYQEFIIYRYGRRKYIRYCEKIILKSALSYILIVVLTLLFLDIVHGNIIFEIWKDIAAQIIKMLLLYISILNVNIYRYFLAKKGHVLTEAVIFLSFWLLLEVYILPFHMMTWSSVFESIITICALGIFNGVLILGLNYKKYDWM